MAQEQLLLPEIRAIAERNNLVLPGDNEPKKLREPAVQRMFALPEPKLPVWRESERGTPNTFLRSSLFAAVQGKQRRQLKDELLGSVEGIVITFSGEQLNQSDLDVWDALVHLARGKIVTSAICFSTHAMLKQSLGLSTGRNDYAWFDSVISRLTGAQIKVTNGSQKYGGTMIHKWKKDEKTGFYSILLNEDLIRLYGPAHWTAIDWPERLQLRKKPLAQALHAFYSSHEVPYAYKFATLKDITGSANTHMPSFRRQTQIALETLKSIGFLKGYHFEGELVHVTRVI